MSHVAAAVLSFALATASSAATGRTAAAPAASALPPLPLDPAPPSPERLRAVDAVIAKAELIARGLEKVADGAERGGGCPPGAAASGLAVDAAVSRFAGAASTGAVAGELSRIVLADLPRWQRYHVCMAVALKNPRVCAGLGLTGTPSNPGARRSLLGDGTPRGSCADYARMIDVYRSLAAKEPAFIDKCAALAPYVEGPTAPAALRKVCEEVLAYSGDPEPYVKAFSQAVSGATREKAMESLHEWLGDAQGCAGLAAEEKALCDDRAAFQAAFAKGKIDACGDRPLCRVMMGAPALACEADSTEVRAAACRIIYTPRYAADQSWAFRNLTDPEIAALSVAGLGDARSEAAVNARLDALFALRERVERAARRVAPKPTAAGIPAPRPRAAAP